MRRGPAAFLLVAGAMVGACAGGSAALPTLEPIPSIAEPAPPAFDVGPPSSAPRSTVAATTPTAVPAAGDPLEALAAAGLAAAGYCSTYAPLPTVTCATVAGDVEGGTVYAVSRVGVAPLFALVGASGNRSLAVTGSFVPRSGVNVPNWAAGLVDYPAGRSYSPYDLVVREAGARSLPLVADCPGGRDEGKWCSGYEVLGPDRVRVHLLAPVGGVNLAWDVDYDAVTDRYRWADGSP